MESKHDELKLRDEWMKEAREMTIEKLPAFLEKLRTFDHDYGTICRAIAAAGVAACWAVERSPQGGITGFQAGCVMWDLITGWMREYEKKPLRLIDYEQMLYPQYEEKFDKTIPEETWRYLQKTANERLKEIDGAHPAVESHWRAISSGVVPFGYRVVKK